LKVVVVVEVVVVLAAAAVVDDADAAFDSTLSSNKAFNSASFVTLALNHSITF